MAWSPIPTPEQSSDDDITVEDVPVVIDDIEIIDEPQIIVDSNDVLVGKSLIVPGPTEVEGESDDLAGIHALFGPEMTAGISVAVLFVIFAIILTGGAPEQPRDLDDDPAAEASELEPVPVAPQVIEVEIGEPLVIERGE